MANETGQRVGDYEVLALLGTGGMGRVYKVRNVISNREEAMKILLPDFASEPELAARFMAEIRTLGGLDHPNIAQLRTAFQFQNQFVMVMEFVEGTTLDKLAGERQIPQDQVLEYSLQVLSALAYAHSRGVTHRDIKPANIMITSHGLVKLMDFGIAKSTGDMQLTRPGTTMGSVFYMSPEQVRGGTIDGRSDIYSFGVTLYEMLTGRKPFNAETSFTVLNAQLNEIPTPPVQWNPALSPELNAIVLRAMEKAPEARFQTADDFRNAIKSILHPDAAVKPAAAPVATPFVDPVAAPFAAQSSQNPMTQPVPTPGYVPVPPPPVAVMPASKSSNRGLWLVLGAVTAILALVAVAWIVPRWYLAHAGQKPAQTATDTQAPATTTDAKNTPPADSSASANAGSTDAGTQPAATTVATPGSAPGSAGASTTAGAPAASGLSSGGSSSPTTGGGKKSKPVSASGGQMPAGGDTGSAGGAPAPPPGPSPQEIREVRDKMMNLDARASSAATGVQQIRSQQQAQGYDLRGDILASMNRMNNFMGEANRALDRNDLEAATQYMDRANKEIETLEKFLGR